MTTRHAIFGIGILAVLVVGVLFTAMPVGGNVVAPLGDVLKPFTSPGSPDAGPAGSPNPPDLVNFQGRLTDPSTGNVVADGSYSISFSIWDAKPSGTGNLVWFETQNVIVNGGLFNVLLGLNTSLTGFNVFNGAPRYLEIKVGADPTLEPRQPFVNVPYAFLATNAEGLAVDGTTALRVEMNATSPNLVGGHGTNSASGVGATIGGGGNSGFPNRVTDDFGTVGGGANNQAGNANADLADAHFATIAGGRDNTASGPDSAVGGGRSNTASSQNGTVGGGQSNTASADYATVGGGWRNDAIGGNATIGGGQDNDASSLFATVSGGLDNTASADDATVGGGFGNSASDIAATVGGGFENTASGNTATVGGGADNYAIGISATVGGGFNNTASGESSTVGGGQYNIASGYSATVAGGIDNTARGSSSFAAGSSAKAYDDGSFVWGDASDVDVASPGPNTFSVRASGGIWLGTTSTPSITAGRFIDTTTGGYLTTGGVWTDSSDVNVKANFASVDAAEILGLVAELPLTSWNFEAEGDAVRHLGPTAQDFYGAFSLGQDDRHIASLDSSGVALAAIQGLYGLVQEKDTQIVALEERLDALEQRASPGAASAGPSSSGLPTTWLLLGGLVVGALALGQLARKTVFRSRA